MLELVGVTKGFRGSPRPVLDGVSAAFPPGLHLVLGPNGAGKTTLLRVLAGVFRPEAGEVRWQGRPVATDLVAYRLRLGYLPQRPAGYPEMTVAEFLGYMAQLKAIPPEWAERRQRELLPALGLGGLERRPLRELSQGQRQLVLMAQALLSDPDVLLLDEPLRGLDHESCQRLLAAALRPGRVTVMASHRPEVPVPGVVATWRLTDGRLVPGAMPGGADTALLTQEGIPRWPS